MSHATAAAGFNQDHGRTTWHDDVLWSIRRKRDRSVYRLPEFQSLRDTASAIKTDVLNNLHDYLIQFESNAIRNGVKVHWAKDADHHNEIVLGIIRNSHSVRVIKSKSMLTEECHLNSFLGSHGIEVTDTDLGERIVQLRNERPSHIVLPAIHLKRSDVGETFHTHLGTPADEDDPERLTAAARKNLRGKFLRAEVAITGVNFAVAENGCIVVCTNEGNADLGVNVAKIHIACMGIEKVIPRAIDLGVFVRLLARSATGQPITTYTSHFARPRPGSEMHVIIVDNGRSKQLQRPDFRSSLKCIRCGACMNTCPVYRRSGGHSYNFTVPGPIGAILSPNIDLVKHKDLPFASTLCGSCTDVCPVKIDIHSQLYKWRQVVSRENAFPAGKKLSFVLLARVLSRPGAYTLFSRLMRLVLSVAPSFLLNNKRLNPWSRSREMPKLPSVSFKEWYRKNRSK